MTHHDNGLPSQESTSVPPRIESVVSACSICTSEGCAASSPLARLICQYGKTSNPELLKQLFELRQFAIRGTVRRIVGDLDVVDDILMEAMIRIMKSATTFDCTRDALPWLKELATNLCIDRLRKSKRDSRIRYITFGMPADENDQCTSTRTLPEPEAPMPAEPYERAYDKMRCVVATLNQRDRVIWKMHWRKRSGTTIAKRLGMSTTTVSTRLEIIRATIRAAL